MLELIASKPCPMAGISFSEEDEQLMRNAEKEGHIISTIIYFHGNIETLAGYDIGICINAEQFIFNNNILTGIYEAHLKGFDNRLRAFIWTDDNMFRGLVVDVTDTEALDYASECYKEKRGYL